MFDCDLSRCFLCRHCLPEWRELIALKKKNLTVKKGKPLFKEGDKVEGIFFLYSGVVKIHAPWADGREMIIRFARSGEIAGHRGLGDEVYPISATALEDTTACFVPNDFWEASLRANSGLTFGSMQFYAAELHKAEQRMRDLNHMDVKGRIANSLLEIETLFGRTEDGTIALTLTRQDIAAYAGTTYETVFKFFNELINEGIIATAGKDIKIIDHQRLTRR
jgi:CRP-like cAMP-binding protein